MIREVQCAQASSKEQPSTATLPATTLVSCPPCESFIDIIFVHSSIIRVSSELCIVTPIDDEAHLLLVKMKES